METRTVTYWPYSQQCQFCKHGEVLEKEGTLGLPACMCYKGILLNTAHPHCDLYEEEQDRESYIDDQEY